MKYRNHTGGLASIEPYYSLHVSAMTSEALHAKSEIAVELAVRDREIATLKMLARGVLCSVEYCDCGVRVQNHRADCDVRLLQDALRETS